MDFYRKLLEILIENIDEGVHVIDKEGKTIIYNKAMESLEGLKGNEVIGKKILELFPSLNENTSTLCNVIKSGKPIGERYQSYVNKKGYNITAVNITLPIKIDDETYGAVEISKDFTKIKELYDRIIHLSDKSKNELKANREYSFDEITGCSPKFLKCIELAKKAAKSSSTVLIYGETGTGKEVLSRCIHNESIRSKKPFVALNCAALPEGLLESILFGTIKGSFTGAVDRIGLFEQANGGTLLLDEINSMSISLQAKLLRVLQEGYIRRVGDVKDIPIDVRIIATTNEDPYTAIVKGTLRKDLYYRLSVINITIPTLRDRKEDIPLFIKEFIKKYNDKFSKDVWDVSKEVYDAFMSYDWPGNVRELKNYIEGAMNMVSGHILQKEHFTSQIQDALFFSSKNDNFLSVDKYSYDISLDEFIDEMEKKIIEEALKKCENNISRTSKLLKIKRQTLQQKIKRYNINL